VRQAVSVANRWLATRGRARRPRTTTAWPGYYTLDTSTDAKTNGMLSVNKVSGAVWYHGWHGRFLGEHNF
jgi:hypothetical protein